MAIALNQDDSLPKDAQAELKLLEAKIAQGNGTDRKLKSHRDERRGFEFKYPDNWQVLSAAEMAAKSKGMMAGAGSDIVLTVANPDDWDQNLILTIPNGRMDGELTSAQIEQFVEQLDRGMARTYENFKKLPHRTITVSGASALEYNMESTRLGEVFRTKEVIFTKGGHAYIVVCTGKQAVFEKLDKENSQVVLKGFQVK